MEYSQLDRAADVLISLLTKSEKDKHDSGKSNRKRDEGHLKDRRSRTHSLEPPISSSRSSGESRDTDRHTIDYIEVPGSIVGFLIGRGGETLKNIERRTNTRVDADKDVGRPIRRIKISGSHRGVNKALNMLTDKVKESEGLSRRR